MFKSFEEILSWQKGRELVKEIYQLTNTGAFSKDFSLKDQIRRAAVSVISNIAEGHERNSNKEFLYFLNIAKGSAGEVRAQLYIALDLKYIGEEDFNRLFDLSREVSRLIFGLKQRIN